MRLPGIGASLPQRCKRCESLREELARIHEIMAALVKRVELLSDHYVDLSGAPKETILAWDALDGAVRQAREACQ